MHHLDKYFLKKDRTPTPQDEFREIQNTLMREDVWIIDGNFTKSIDNRIAFADTIILFDFSKYLNLWRTLKRFFKHIGTVRPEMGGDNKEALQWRHLKYIVTFPRKDFYSRVTQLVEGKKVVVLQNPKEASDFLGNARQTHYPAP